jgi:hypothetical protein
MNSKRASAYIFGVPVAVAIGTTPIFATTSAIDDIPKTFEHTAEIELVYPLYAQISNEEISGPGPGPEVKEDRDPPVVNAPPVPATPEVTASIVEDLEEAQAICQFMGDEYKIDCFARTYRELAKNIPGNGDYAEAREALLDAARKLDNITRRNLDRQKPALTARLQKGGGQTVTTPPIRAVRSDRVTQLKQQAANVVQEAETVLLRSASSDATRAIHYQRIAAVVESNKVLLRSG